MSIESLQQMSRFTIYSLSFTFFIHIFFVDGFSKKIKIHSLFHWLVPKKIRVTYEFEAISTRKSDQMCSYLNIILALGSYERFFFGFSVNTMIYLQEIREDRQNVHRDYRS